MCVLTAAPCATGHASGRWCDAVDGGDANGRTQEQWRSELERDHHHIAVASDARLRLRSHNPGGVVEIALVAAPDVALPQP